MLPLRPDFEPMLAALAEQLPEGEGWLYEPKWDGFRAVVFRDDNVVHIMSRKGQPLQRYFPELVDALTEALPKRCVVDGEIIIVTDHGLDFDALLQRIHPAQSRINKLSKQTPTQFVAFDLLALDDEDLRSSPLSNRREQLQRVLHRHSAVHLTPQTADAKLAGQWFTRFEGAGLDGVIAKRRELNYQPGERVMVKVKHLRSTDCVVGGYRVHKTGGAGSLLLGLYDDKGVLQYVGHTSSFSAKERRKLLEQLEPLSGGESFVGGRAPGGPSRWSQGKDTTWVPMAPKLVCEVTFDYLQGDRFRHAARFMRWRPDKAPEQCTWAQLLPPKRFKFEDVLGY